MTKPPAFSFVAQSNSNQVQNKDGLSEGTGELGRGSRNWGGGVLPSKKIAVGKILCCASVQVTAVQAEGCTPPGLSQRMEMGMAGCLEREGDISPSQKGGR